MIGGKDICTPKYCGLRREIIGINTEKNLTTTIKAKIFIYNNKNQNSVLNFKVKSEPDSKSNILD